MKIGIDARFVGPQGTGLGKYTEKLITNLAKIDTKNQYVVFLKKDNWDYLTTPKNFKKILANVPWYSLAEQLKMPGIFKSQNLDLLHVPHFNVPIIYRGKFVVTIHDLIHHDFKNDAATTRNPIVFQLKRFAYKKVIENAIYKSVKIITPSNFVKAQIAQKFSIDPSKIIVTYEAAEEEYFRKISNFDFRKGTSQFRISNYIVYVGNAYPHKNLNSLLDAMKILNFQLSTFNSKLVLICPRDVFSSKLNFEIAKRNLQKKVELKDYLAPEQLSKLFQKSQAYVFPTLSEGFGIPGLNALASGLPLVASGIPVLKEVYGEAALYFDPKDPNDIAQKISRVLKDQKLKSELIKKGKAQAKKYSWQKMAHQTLSLYESCQ